MRPLKRDTCAKLFSSCIGSASMSARRPIARPLPVASPRMTPTTPVLPTPAWNSTPSAASSRATTSAVRCSSKPSSGCACRSRRTAVSSACCARRNSTGPMNKIGCGLMGRGETLDTKPRVHRIVQEIDDEIDQHEYERDKAQVGRHHRHVGEAYRLNEQESHAGPLKHRLGND